MAVAWLADTYRGVFSPGQTYAAMVARGQVVNNRLLTDLSNLVTELAGRIHRTKAAIELARTIPSRKLRIESSKEARRQLTSLIGAHRHLTKMVKLGQSLVAAPAVAAWEGRVLSDIGEANRIIRTSEEVLPRLVNSASKAAANARTSPSRLPGPRLP